MVQLFPPMVDPSTLSPQVWNVPTARSLPAVGKALAVYTSHIGQLPMDAVRGADVLARPRMLDRPDPDMARLNFVGVQIEDYLLHGNACHLVTAWGWDGYPAAVRWFPAWRWGIEPDASGQPVYRLDGRTVPRSSVVHVQRGADPAFPWRGMGVVEQHLRTLNRAGLESEAGAETMRTRGMPAVAVITPQTEPPKRDKTTGRSAWDDAADRWVDRFAGTENRPAFFPSGTQVQPLSWNPEDQQMIEARKLSLVDVANIFNLDGYWLNAETSSHTYRSPGPYFLTLLRSSLTPVIDVFEDVWGTNWLAYGKRVRFDTTKLRGDDLATMAATFGNRIGTLWTSGEAREFMGWPAEMPEDPNKQPVPAALADPNAADPAADPNAADPGTDPGTDPATDPNADPKEGAA